MATVPTGRTLRSSTDVTAAGSSWTMTWTVWPSDDWTWSRVWATSAARTWRGHLGGRHADGDGLVRVDGDLDLGGGLDEVALEVDDVGLVLERPDEVATVALSTSAANSPVTVTLKPPLLNPKPEDTVAA